jgi:hypothetical protein
MASLQLRSEPNTDQTARADNVPADTVCRVANTALTGKATAVSFRGTTTRPSRYANKPGVFQMLADFLQFAAQNVAAIGVVAIAAAMAWTRFMI